MPDQLTFLPYKGNRRLFQRQQNAVASGASQTIFATQTDRFFYMYWLIVECSQPGAFQLRESAAVKFDMRMVANVSQYWFFGDGGVLLDSLASDLNIINNSGVLATITSSILYEQVPIPT